MLKNGHFILKSIVLHKIYANEFKPFETQIYPLTSLKFLGNITPQPLSMSEICVICVDLMHEYIVDT